MGHKMFMDALKKVGLDDREIAAYLALLELGEATAPSVAQKTKIERSTAYRILDKLISKGFVAYVIKKNVKYYSASEPKTFLSYIKETHQELLSLLPKLEELKGKSKIKTIVQVYKGKDGAKTVLKDIINAGEDYFVFGYEGQFRKIFPKTYLTQYMRDLKINKITEKMLVKQGIKISKSAQTKIKYLPKELSSPTTTIIYSNKIGHIIWTDPYFVILIENKEISESYKNYFNLLWKIAKQS